MTIRFSDKVILAKPETVYGTDPTPTGAANAILMTNVSFSPMEGEDVSRELIRPFLGNQGTLSAGLRAVLTGSTELAGSGVAGTAPAWGVLARACAMAETVVEDTSVAYTRVSDAHESATIYFWQGETLQKMTGVRGNGVLTVAAQGIPRIEWTLTGLWAAPAEQTQAVPVFTPWKAPLVANKVNTPSFKIDTVARVLRTFTLNLGGQVEPRLLIGSEDIRIVDTLEQISATIEAVPLSTFNPFDKARTKTSVAIELVHGTTAGGIITIAAPRCEVMRPGAAEDQQNVVEWPLQFRPLPDTGDDQLTITLT